MIKTLTIQNFRSHKDVVLKDCGRINILLGRNNSRKTAVLEAILMLCFPPSPREVLILLNDQRGYKPGDENYELWDSYANTYIEGAVASLNEKHARLAPPAHRHGKAKIHAFLATFEEPDKDPGKAALAGVWDFNHPALNPIRNILYQM